MFSLTCTFILFNLVVRPSGRLCFELDQRPWINIPSNDWRWPSTHSMSFLDPLYSSCLWRIFYYASAGPVFILFIPLHLTPRYRHCRLTFSKLHSWLCLHYGLPSASEFYSGLWVFYPLVGNGSDLLFFLSLCCYADLFTRLPWLIGISCIKTGGFAGCIIYRKNWSFYTLLICSFIFRAFIWYVCCAGISSDPVPSLSDKFEASGCAELRDP